MTLSRLATVVSTNWLREHLGSQIQKKASKSLRVLDTSYVLNNDIDTYRECYMQGHIPTSVHFDLNKCCEHTVEIPRNIPDVDCFSNYAKTLGIWPDTHIVTYDRFGPLASYRAWWLFRMFGHRKISVLDGGLRKWVEDGYEVTSDVPEVEVSDFKVQVDKRLIRGYEDMLGNVSSKREQVVEARSLDHPTVSDEEQDGGTLPGAKIVSFNDLFNEDQTIKSDRELKALFDSAGVDLGQPVVTSCLTGLTACGVAAAAHILGKENVPVYYGSWMEWKQKVPEELKFRPKK